MDKDKSKELISTKRGKNQPTSNVPVKRHGFHSKARQKLIESFFRDDLKPDELDFMDMKEALKKKNKYDERLGIALMDHMGKGMSYASFAGVLNISQSQLQRWEHEHPEWKEWKMRAYAKALNFWENILVQGAAGDRKSEAKQMIFKLKNMFPEEYKDKVEIENTTPTQIIINGLDGGWDGKEVFDAESKEVEEDVTVIEYNEEIDDV